MIVCMIIATVMSLLFIILFLSADSGLTSALLISCRENELEKIKEKQVAIELIINQVRKTGDLKNKKYIREARKLQKQKIEAEQLLEKYNAAKISGFDLIPVVGYRVIQLLKWDVTNKTVKELFIKCQQFKERKEAMNYTYYLLSALLGYVLLAIVALFALLGLFLSMGMGTRSVVMAVAVFVVFILIGYVPYDNVNVVIQKRAEEIEVQFPQVVSKMALLTVAGLEVSQAWELTANSGVGVLYEEMKRVIIDLNNNVSPLEAYSKFIARCNNKYTTKLATSIIQNISKGNSEIVKLFSQLNEESWLEHKHNARRMGEKIQSKLLVPTILMFVGIMILVIVPVISGFNF